MDIKDLIAFGALGVSLLSAWNAIDARNTADELKGREFSSDKTLDILGRVYTEILTARSDAERAKWSCFFVATLGSAEEAAIKEPPFYVRTFINDVAKAGLWNADCASRIESIVSDQPPAASPATPAAVDGNAAPPIGSLQQIGQWHALIASYNITPRGCKFAQDDVAYFAKALAGRGLDGAKVYIVETSVSRNYAVTVDAGADRNLAERIADEVRRVAPANGTGRDSFVQGNRGWMLASECPGLATVAVSPG